MALRTKRIEYSFPLHGTSLASATARNWNAAGSNNITVNIPENTSRTFRSVMLVVSFCDGTTATGVSTTAINMGSKVGAAALNTATVTQTIAQTGENYTVTAIKDETSYWQTNFTGTSQTVEAQLTVTGPITLNASAKLIITYEYDDTSQTTRIKTVKIPIDGNIGALTASFTTIGTTANQYPALDTFLPEASKTYRDIFFEINAHTGTTATATSALTMRYDGSTSVAETSWAYNLASDTYRHRIDKLIVWATNLPAVTTNATHTIEALVTSTTASPFDCISGVLVVTYEYDHENSTTILNSLEEPVIGNDGWVAGTATGDKDRFKVPFMIEEPGTITLVQSGIMFSCIDAGAVSLDIRVGSQASRVYAHPATVRDGSIVSQRRIDSGAIGGAGVTLARGENAVTIDVFTTSATAGNIGSHLSAVMYLNYTSSKHTDGDGVHAHTTAWLITPYETGGLVQRKQDTPISTPNIPETDYWIDRIGYHLYPITSGSGIGTAGLSVKCEVGASEAEQAGWRSITACLYATDTEQGQNIQFACGCRHFKRWPNDSDLTRLDLETARNYRYDCSVNTAMIWQMFALVTYHAIKYAIAGTISSSSGGTVTIRAYRKSDGLYIGETSRTGNGTYTITWYDNVENVFTEARESGTLIGRSDDGTAA